jgi:hypothetical protein
MQDTSGTSRKLILYKKKHYISQEKPQKKKTFADSQPELKEKTTTHLLPNTC